MPFKPRNYRDTKVRGRRDNDLGQIRFFSNKFIGNVHC